MTLLFLPQSLLCLLLIPPAPKLTPSSNAVGASGWENWALSARVGYLHSGAGGCLWLQCKSFQSPNFSATYQSGAAGGEKPTPCSLPMNSSHFPSSDQWCRLSWQISTASVSGGLLGLHTELAVSGCRTVWTRWHTRSMSAHVHEGEECSLHCGSFLRDNGFSQVTRHTAALLVSLWPGTQGTFYWLFWVLWLNMGDGWRLLDIL